MRQMRWFINQDLIYCSEQVLYETMEVFTENQAWLKMAKFNRQMRRFINQDLIKCSEHVLYETMEVFIENQVWLKMAQFNRRGPARKVDF